jgi:hypothetical protein
MIEKIEHETMREREREGECEVIPPCEYPRVDRP